MQQTDKYLNTVQMYFTLTSTSWYMKVDGGHSQHSAKQPRSGRTQPVSQYKILDTPEIGFYCMDIIHNYHLSPCALMFLNFHCTCSNVRYNETQGPYLWYGMWAYIEDYKQSHLVFWVASIWVCEQFHDVAIQRCRFTHHFLLKLKQCVQSTRFDIIQDCYEKKRSIHKQSLLHTDIN